MVNVEQALVWNRQGNELRRAGEFEAAVRAHEQAVQLYPSGAQVWHDLALSYLEWRKYEAAEAGFRMALNFAPKDPQLHYSLGTTLQHLGRFDDATRHLLTAVELQPDYAAALVNLGSVLKEVGDFAASAEALSRALASNPNDWEALWNLSLLELQLSQYEDGWDHYEARRRNPKWKAPRGAAWDGAARHDADLLVTFEQGLGDTLQFMRFLRLARERVRRIVFMANPPLMRLLEGFSDVDQIIAREEDGPGCALGAPLMSLPHLLRIGARLTLDDRPYLSANSELVKEWGRELTTLSGFRVGIAWQGNPAYRNDRLRSIPLSVLAPLLRVSGTTFVSLQKTHGREQLASLPGEIKLLDFGSRLDEKTGAFCDTAAVMMGLNLVITSDTAIAHLAGALGVETWLLLAAVPDWRWGIAGHETPWYPRMRLFRQTRPGDWGEVVNRVRDELTRRSSEAS